MKKVFMILVAAAMAVTMLSCTNENGGVSGVKHVVMIGLDGLAGNTVEAADMPTVKQMMAEGAWTLQARSILPSSSACNWASMYMGVGPEMHGYNTWGSRTPDFPSIELGKNGIFPTILTVLREHNPEMNICAMYEWDVQGDLIDNKAALSISIFRWARAVVPILPMPSYHILRSISPSFRCVYMTLPMLKVTDTVGAQSLI